MLTFNKRYFIFTVLLFSVEVLIALFVHDRFVRPYVGDVLVVMLMYSFIRSFFKTPVTGTAIFVLAFAFAIEVLQYLKIVEVLGLQNSKVARTMIGTFFEWRDLVAYVIGFVIILVLERRPWKATEAKRP